MRIPTPRVFFWTAVSVAVGIVALSVYASASLYTAAPAAVPAQRSVSPAELIASYQASFTQVTTELTSLLQRTVTSADVPALTEARTRLVALAVPASAQSYHLQVVLALGRLIDNLSGANGGAKVALSAKRDPQLQLKQLLATSVTK